MWLGRSDSLYSSFSQPAYLNHNKEAQLSSVFTSLASPWRPAVARHWLFSSLNHSGQNTFSGKQPGDCLKGKFNHVCFLRRTFNYSRAFSQKTCSSYIVCVSTHSPPVPPSLAPSSPCALVTLLLTTAWALQLFLLPTIFSSPWTLYDQLCFWALPQKPSPPPFPYQLPFQSLPTGSVCGSLVLTFFVPIASDYKYTCRYIFGLHPIGKIRP